MAKPQSAPKTQTAGFMIFSGLMLLILTSVVLALFLNRLHIQAEPEIVTTQRIQDLVSLLKQAQTKGNMLELEITQLRKKMMADEKTQKIPTRSEDLSQKPELQKLYRLAGFTPVSGDGVIVTLQDNKNPPIANDSHADPNYGKLQADDLLKLVNDLKAAGATAISINDQRMVTTSEIVAAGPTILVNQTPIHQPVVVKVLGNPNVLTSALKFRGGIIEYLDFFNIKVSIQKEDTITLPAYKGPLPS